MWTLEVSISDSLGNNSNRSLWHVLFEPLESGKETFQKLMENIVFINIFIKTHGDKVLPYLRISLIVMGYSKTAQLLVSPMAVPLNCRNFEGENNV